MKVTRRVDTVTIEVDINEAEKIAAVLGQVIDFTDPTCESFQPLVDALRAAGVRQPSPLYRATVQNGYPVIERSI